MEKQYTNKLEFNLIVLTSHFLLLEVCLFHPIAAQIKVMHDDESTLVQALP